MILCTKFENIEFGFSSNFFGFSNSITSPLSNTKTLSLLMTVLSRWAIVITVESLNFSFMSLCITCSVLMSMLAVASSISTTLFCFKIALQMQSSCFSPELRFWPCSSMSWSRPLSSRAISLSRAACDVSSSRSWSV